MKYYLTPERDCLVIDFDGCEHVQLYTVKKGKQVRDANGLKKIINRTHSWGVMSEIRVKRRKYWVMKPGVKELTLREAIDWINEVYLTEWREHRRKYKRK